MEAPSPMRLYPGVYVLDTDQSIQQVTLTCWLLAAGLLAGPVSTQVVPVVWAWLDQPSNAWTTRN